jgi:glutamine synthetase
MNMTTTLDERYALTNPLVVLLDKERGMFTRRDLLRVIEQRGIQKLTFHYTALDGKLKELKIPVAGRLQAERVLADGERVDGSSLFRGMLDASVSDLYVVPLYKSAFLNPFDETSLDFMCRYFMRDGTPAPFAPDCILHKAARLFTRNTGMELHAMGELEFFLIGELGARVYPLTRQRGYHASAPFAKSGPILDEMVHHISRITGAVKYAHGEVGCVERLESEVEEISGKQAEQLEVEFIPEPIEDAGDTLVLARWLIRTIAYRHGFVATFAPKLEEGVAGNGQHIHMELMREGRNVMTDAEGQLSIAAKQLIGGLCAHAGSLTAFGNTVASAYLRLVPDQEAPTHICWSDMNRSTLIRVPLGWSNLGSAITHLLLAGIAMAAEWGATHEESAVLADTLYISGNVFQHQQLPGGLGALPGSCVESARILLKNRAAYERDGVFPASMIEFVAGVLQTEDDERMNLILSGLPMNDRHREARKLMHRDLHRH